MFVSGIDSRKLWCARTCAVGGGHGDIRLSATVTGLDASSLPALASKPRQRRLAATFPPRGILGCVGKVPDGRVDSRFVTESTNAASPASPGDGDAMSDPLYREGVIDLLGVLAYNELVAFERLAADASSAPTLSDKSALALMASAEIRHFTLLAERLAELGVDPADAMAPFVDAIEDFHTQTAPSDWYESLVKAYVGDGIASDFYREIAHQLDPQTRDLVLDVCSDTGHSNFAVATILAAIDRDPRLSGRLALWGRRFVGEAISQAQRVAAERDGLSRMLIGDVNHPGMDFGDLGEMFARLTAAHTQRMQILGLQA